MEELTYTTQEILNQQFKTKMRGYDPEEVDEFLDNIIRDYETMQREVLALEEENEQLREQVEKLSKTAPISPKAAPEAKKSTTVTNFDILKRLSNLEREVFGNKLNHQSPVATPAAPVASQEPKAFEEPEIDHQATRLF